MKISGLLFAEYDSVRPVADESESGEMNAGVHRQPPVREGVLK